MRSYARSHQVRLGSVAELVTEDPGQIPLLTTPRI